MKSLENKTALIFDLFFCIVLMPLLLFLGPARHWLENWPLFFYLVCLYLFGCYFITRYLKLPKLILSRQYYKIAGIAAVLVGCTYLLSWYPLPEMDFLTPVMSRYQTTIRNYNVAISLWLMFSVVICYALTTAFVTELYEQLLAKRQIENQRDKAELAVFKAQISPHFLFNTLNSLYSLVIANSPKTEDAFIKFTELLKYTYTTISNESVPLREEIVYIRNYIDLQAIRLNSCTRVVWECDVDNDNTMIPPMILLTFVENAFKYGASTSRECTINISIALHDGILRFETRNSIMKHAPEFHSDMPVGLANCRARLNGIFPGRYSLDTVEHDGTFTVSLRINLEPR